MLTAFQERHKFILQAAVQAANDGLPYIAVADFDMNHVDASKACQCMQRLGFIERHNPRLWWLSITDAGREYLALLEADTINEIATWQAQPRTALWALETADAGLRGKPHAIVTKAAPYVIRYLGNEYGIHESKARINALAKNYPAIRMWGEVGVPQSIVKSGVDVSDASGRNYLLMSEQLTQAVTRTAQRLNISEHDVKRAAIAHFVGLFGTLESEADNA